MAFTSFTVRNTIGNSGSALRRTRVVQDSTTPNGSGEAVSDSGLRADGFFPPVPESFLESTFEANVYSRDTITLNWTFGFTLVSLPTGTEPVEVLIRASSTGEPITAGDGDKVISVTADNFRLDYEDKNPFYIKEGNWVYYSMFVRYEDSSGDGFYERVATLSAQIPRNFNSTEDLWSRIPEYYRSLDADYALNTADYNPKVNPDKGPLYRYVELFGWELDKMRTTIYDTMRINDPEVVHSSAINALANQSGIEFTKEALGTSKLRAVLNNIGYLRRTKGTQSSVEAYISALSGCGVTATGSSPIQFNVHPMRVNLFTDPFFVQGLNAPVSPDTGSTRREWTNLDSGGRKYGWGVYAKFSSTPPSAMTLSTTGDGLTVTLPAMTGTVELLIYSRGNFVYNNNLAYFYSAVSSHNFTPRFVLNTTLTALEGSSPPSSVTYFDDWNNSVTTFPSFKDFLTNDSRKIVSSIQKTTSVSSNNVIPVYKFNITLSSGSVTTVTFEKPLVEYKNSDGSFFSGDEPLGGFIQDPTDSLGAGLYDYHWGTSAGGSSGTDFSYYTMDEHRVQKVVDNIIENYIVPVTIVKGTDYVINWNVLE